MSQDYTGSKPVVGAVYPINALDSAWIRLEPMVDAAQLKVRYLFGLPLVSAIRDPLTNKAQIMTDEIIKDYILRAVSEAETDTSLDIFPIKNREKHPFNRFDYESFGYMRTLRRPVSSIEKFTVTPSNNQDIYMVPLDWVETAHLAKGQLNIIPLTFAIVNGVNTPMSSGGAVFLSMFANRAWIGSFWQIEYTSGFVDGQLPIPINEYVGVVAAINILSALAATYAKTTGQSLGIDGLSQSQSGPGPQLFAQRIKELTEKREKLKNKLKKMWGQSLFSGDV